MTQRPAKPHRPSDADTARDRSSARPARSEDAIRQLQRSAGNAATARLLGGRDRSTRARAGHAIVVQREGPQTSAPNFDDLDAAYQVASEKERSLYDHRSIGARELLANLKEEDAPSIADILLKAAIMGALGFASGGISQAITGRLADGASNAMQTAVQSGIDDATKDAVPAVVAMAMARGGTSQSSFFAGIEAGVLSLREAAVIKLSEQQRQAKEAARRDTSTLPRALAEIKRRQTVVDGLKETAQQLQYREALSQWFSAAAQAKVGVDKTVGGTAMDKLPGHGGDPSRFFHRKASHGVLRLIFGLRAEHPAPADQPRRSSRGSTTRPRPAWRARRSATCGSPSSPRAGSMRASGTASKRVTTRSR